VIFEVEIVQGEKRLVETESIVCFLPGGVVKKIGTGLRMTCPRSEEETSRLI